MAIVSYIVAISIVRCRHNFLQWVGCDIDCMLCLRYGFFDFVFWKVHIFYRVAAQIELAVAVSRCPGQIRTGQDKMFKEVVSLAIILGFMWNVLFVEHPDRATYTVAFVLSLLVLAPFVVFWRYWAATTRLNEMVEVEDQAQTVMGMGRDVMSDVLGLGARGGEIALGADVEKGLVLIDEGEVT